tara:strand:+ start:1055 stop:1561 length:507 start_codon:yes stop_codon:yes gene_type:complete
MKIDKDKPSLDHLFESKKFDLPSEDFWDGFQNQVKERVLSSISRSSHSHRILTASFCAAPLLSVILYLIFPSNILEKEESSIVNSFVESSSQVTNLLQSTNHIEVLESLENTEYEIVNNDQTNDNISNSESSFFAEEKLQLNVQSSYEIQYLGNFELNHENLLARYTF